MVFKKIIFQNRYVALETPSRPPRDPPPLHGKYHLKFPFWLLEPLPKLAYKRLSCLTRKTEFWQTSTTIQQNSGSSDIRGSWRQNHPMSPFWHKVRTIFFDRSFHFLVRGSSTRRTHANTLDLHPVKQGFKLWKNWGDLHIEEANWNPSYCELSCLMSLIFFRQGGHGSFVLVLQLACHCDVRPFAEKINAQTILHVKTFTFLQSLYIH